MSLEMKDKSGIKSLKILHINNVADMGRLLSEALNEEGFDTYFLDISSKTAKLPNFLKYLLFLERLFPVWQIWKFILKNKIDVIHVHYFSAFIWFWFFPGKKILHAHGCDVRTTAKWRILINRFLIKKADLVLYSTPDLKACIDDLQHESYFLPNITEENLIYKALEKPKGDLPQRKKILFYSSLSEIKGAKAALEAIKQVKSKNNDVDAYVLDFGDLSHLVGQYPVIPLPKQKKENLFQLASEMDFILGQLHLGAIGVSELEAMLLGKNIIANFQYAKSYPTPPPLFSTSEDPAEISKIMLEMLEGKVPLHSKEEIANWVRTFHGKVGVTHQLISYYENTLKDVK
jgi:glycosyltransferase involved in cell wall biosynthesis